jgi:hypothetical protein
MLFGGRPGKNDPELAKAVVRRREAFARDIGDEQGRAFAHEEPRRRSRWTSLLGLGLVLFAGIGLIPLLRGGDGGLLSRQCDRPAVGASAGLVAPGSRAAWQAAGPDSGEYVVTLDGDGVRVDAAGGVVAPSGRVLAAPFRLTDCRSAQTLFDAPTQRGSHEVTLFRRTGTTYQPVASTEVKVG